jgi:predicted PurR-regulated permease PerM
MSLIDARTTRVLFTVLLFALVLGFFYVAHNTLIAFLFAVFFAYLIDPAVSRLEKWTKGRRGLAIAIIYFALVILLATFFFFVGPRIGRQAQRLTQSMPGLLENGGSTDIGQIAVKLGQDHGWSTATQQKLHDYLQHHQNAVTRIAQRIGVRLAQAASDVWLLVLIPILAAFFLKDGRAFGESLLGFFHTRAQREFAQGVLDDMNQMLAHFIRAQLTLAAFSFLAYSIFMGSMRVPNALVLGTAGGMMEFVPVIGPFVAAAVIMLVALVMGYQYWYWLLLFLGAWRLMQDYVISPRIMGRSLELHPLAAIFGVLAGGEIAGILGIYLSIPIMASLRIVWRRWRLYAEKRRFGPLNEYSFGTEVTPRE